ncbi:MAG: HPr kinase/phosphorylase [Bordetella sp. SCN 67-23]|nr:HPr kinase/phosphorylase [Burkholderiales bacterium]ODS73268.1 MAG: HPr kinase/phosphorylase [Bordetella sp. SCN 67-23]ODU92691.1 MAG: HPr kinase/phosphorylase [Bordetella sp. SCN 68-11]OJW92799.1 MAG: HPr kinase/phosphorylase [Burkholderiales bacterium 67-32]
MLTIEKLVDENTDKISLSWLAGRSNANRSPLPDTCLAAADLVGHLNLIHPSRIQVFGHEELAFYARLEARRRAHHLDELLASGVPAIIMADGLAAPADLLEHCVQRNVPLLASPRSAAQVIDLLRIYLAKKLAPVTTVHGVFMDVLGMGVLISGESGLGKSELALELISRGHGLVADDAVEFSRIAPNLIEGRCPPLLQNMLEVRGLGLLDIRAIFGETSVRRKMKLKIIVHLVRTTSPEANFERLPLQAMTQDVLALPIRKVVLPVAAGRNLAVLVEAAVRNAILQLRGIDTMTEFMERQMDAIQNGEP